MKSVTLRVVGTGMNLAGQISIEARNAIADADIVLSLTGDPIFDEWLKSLNANQEGLEECYKLGPRPLAYRAMADRILREVRAGKRVCAAFYGHPGVFVAPSHDVIRRARSEGFGAEMLPGISAEDCLFSDLGIDPGALGCQSYEARDFFLHERRFDSSAALILWQIAVLGDASFTELRSNPAALRALSLVLMETYPPEHEVVVYVAATLPTERPRIQRVTISALEDADVDQCSTLYVPPLGAPRLSQTRVRLLQRLVSLRPN